jgi:hypothetical protein
MDGPMSKKEDLIAKARLSFERASEYWADNHKEATDDLRFARLNEQWPEKIRKQRELEGRPCEVFNKMPAFIRQVVNDARQNKPGIKVHPQDSGADPEVADIIQGLIRNIEVTSDADVAYDTAIECAVDRGLGYWRVNTRYTCDDTFDQDIVIERVSNPLTILGDPNSTAADSSDWNDAWVVTTLTHEEFEAEYPNAEKVDWDTDFKDAPDGLACDDNHVTVAEWWTREKVKKQIVALQDGSIVDVKELPKLMAQFGPLQTVGEPREVDTYKVTQRILTGAEVLKEVKWAGKYIPIIPVYGDEITDEKGKRHFHSLHRPAHGSQRMYNYMRNTSIEYIALQPKAPFIGEEGAFDADPNWEKANDQNIPFLQYAKGHDKPERAQPPQGSQAVMQEALNANDDMKAIIGIYDPSLGARSNETSGVAIRERKMEGDVSTFHFIDNLQRAIRHGGRVVMDLIPKVFSTERIARILGEDMEAQNVQVAPTGQPVTEQVDPNTGALIKVYDLTVGKYDLTVSAGPNFTTRREEMAQTLGEIINAAPQTAPVLVSEWVKQMDFPNAEEVAQKLAALDPTNQQAQQQQMQQAVGEVQQQAQQALQEQGQQLQQMQQTIQQLQMQLKDKSMEAQIKARELALKDKELDIKAFEANVRAQQPTKAPAINQ